MSYNMFFLLEENNRPDIIRCENLDTTYTMLDVIQTDVSISCLEDDSDSSESSEEVKGSMMSSRMFD